MRLSLASQLKAWAEPTHRRRPVLCRHRVLLLLRNFEARLKNTASISEFSFYGKLFLFLDAYCTSNLIVPFCFNFFSYAQEIPSRFKKDIVRAAKQDNTDRVALEGMQQVIANINMQHRISRSDMETIFREIGGEAGAIPAERFMSII